MSAFPFKLCRIFMFRLCLGCSQTLREDNSSSTVAAPSENFRFSLVHSAMGLGVISDCNIVFLKRYEREIVRYLGVSTSNTKLPYRFSRQAPRTCSPCRPRIRGNPPWGVWWKHLWIPLILALQTILGPSPSSISHRI